MFDQVYANQTEWSDLTGTARTDMFVGYAKKLGLDETKFTADLAGSAATQKISFDQAIGNKLGVDSTPTFYLNGVKVGSDIVQDVQSGNGDKLRALLDADLKKVSATPPT